jgi:hypothetical protein
VTQPDLAGGAVSDARAPKLVIGTRAAAASGRLLLLLALTACGGLRGLPGRRTEDRRTPSTRAAVDERIRGLVNLEGEYWFGDGVYSLMENEAPLHAIAAADTIGIRSLVTCLSDARRTRMTLRGEPVPVGLLCAEALTRTEYFQTGLKRGAFAATWAGTPPLTTDPLALARVQRAWFEWLHDHQLAWQPLPASSLACPSRDSMTAERFRDSISTDGSRRTSQRIQETVADYRYVTYVVDSEFVVLSDAHPRTAQDSVRGNALQDLAPGDIASISVRKSEHEAWKWRACEGVPVVLIATRSKRWRPRPSR